MNHKNIRIAGFFVLLTLWGALAVWAWLGPDAAFSDAERRPLKQRPELTVQSLTGGKFMQDFEGYTLDQFPLRDGFRTLKSLFHYHVLQQNDNNGIYIVDGSAAKLEPTLNNASVSHALNRFQHIYDKYLKDTGSAVFSAVVPDKGYYLAQSQGYPTMDYGRLFAAVQSGMPWATHIDLTDCLQGSDYYRTDTHWRQEKLLPVARKLAQTMGLSLPELADYTLTKLDRPFYGVYYGQAALPMEPDELYVLESDLLSGCSVYSHEAGKTASVYDKTKLDSKDLYDVFLSGPQALLTIESPNASTDRELIVFRDSFGSSLIPLLLSDYRTVTVVDIRYVASDLLGNFVTFSGQDVLFLYSTLVLNSSSTLK